MSDRRPRFRCSGLDRVFRCHGSYSLTYAPAAREDEEDEDSEMAAVGTWGHYLVARWALRRFLAYAPPGGLPRPAKKPEKWSNFARWAVEYCCRQLLTQALARLSAKEAALVVALARDGMTHDEAAALLDCSTKTVQRMLDRIRIKLADKKGVRHALG